MTLWFVAGETSGDSRAAEVMRALRELRPDIVFAGAGGPRMQEFAGRPFDNWTAQAAVLGLWDVLRHYGYFKKKFRRMLVDIQEANPVAVVLVDYPGFNLRLANALRKSGYGGKILYYISPQVWAWNRGRIPRMAKTLDLMICVFPFEAPMYEASGLHTVFVGHPLLEALEQKKNSAPREPGLVGFFPGSREREVRRIFPAMIGAAAIIRREFPGIRFEAAAASEAHAEKMRAMTADIVVRAGTAHSLMQRATAGVVCSGTATLEAAFFGLPYCLVYKIAWLTFEIGKRLVHVDGLGIVNILNNYRKNPPPDPRLPARPAPHVVREFIQSNATPEALAEEVLRLLRDETSRETLSRKLLQITSELAAHGASERAAAALLQTLESGSASELLLHLAAERAAVNAALRLGIEDFHDRPHLLARRGPGFRDRFAHEARDLFGTWRRRKKNRKNRDLRTFVVRHRLPPAFFESLDGIMTFLDLLAHDGHRVGVVECTAGPALLNGGVHERGLQHAQHAEPERLARQHGRLDFLVDPSLKRHS